MDIQREKEFIDNFEKAYTKYVEIPMENEIRKLILDSSFEIRGTINPQVIFPNDFRKELTKIAESWGLGTEKLFLDYLNDVDKEVLDLFQRELKRLLPKQFRYKRAEYKFNYNQLLKKVGDKWRSAIIVNEFASKWYTRKYYNDGLSLSDRVWKYANESAQKIQNQIALNLRLGNSALNTARQIQEANEQIVRIPKYLQKQIDLLDNKNLASNLIDNYVKKTLHYNAMRVARTEINNAWKGSYKEKMDQLDFVENVKWNLSRSHKEPCNCETYASQDLYGLGPGIYPKNAVPHNGLSAHPNCLCNITMILSPVEKWIESEYRKS